MLFINKVWFSQFKVRGLNWPYSMSISLILRTSYDDFGYLNGDIHFKTNLDSYFSLQRQKLPDPNGKFVLASSRMPYPHRQLNLRTIQTRSARISIHRPLCLTREYTCNGRTLHLLGPIYPTQDQRAPMNAHLPLYEPVSQGRVSRTPWCGKCST